MKIKIIELLNKIANREIEDKRTFNLVFPDRIHRSIYYDNSETNCFKCLKNVSDNKPIYDDIDFFDEVEIIEEDKPIKELKTEIVDTERKLKGISGTKYSIRVVDNILINKINELVKETNKLKENK